MASEEKDIEKEMEREKLTGLDQMKTKLSSKTFASGGVRREGFTHFVKKNVPTAWQKEEKVNTEEKFYMKTSMFKKFFIFSIVFFALALAFAAYMFFAGGNTVSNDNIDIAVLGNAFTAGGEELPLQVEITNRNNSALELADLVIEYPKSSSGDLSNETERFRESLGSIPSGGVRNENMKITLFGEQGSIRPIRITLEYRVEGSNAIFVKEKAYQVTISSAPINISVNAPTEASPNQEIAFDIKTSLNATKAASKILLKVDYPVGFQFVSAKPSPSLGNNVWNLGDLVPGAERTISVIGKMVDVSDGEEKTFHIWSGTQSDNDKSSIGVVFNSLSHTVVIQKPFIEAKLYINGQYAREYASDTRTPIQGEIRWANNLNTKLSNVVIRAKISGNAVNRKSIQAEQGFYNSNENTLIWDKNSNPAFMEIEPGDAGSVGFSLSPNALFSSSGLLETPAIGIEVSIEGAEPLEGNSVKKLTNSETKIIRIISELGLAAKALYYSGPFANTGPIPPKVEQETTYTVTWTLSNTANNVSNAQVRATLPPWMRFVGPISPPQEDLTYNSSTKEITWKVGGIPKGTGLSGADREVSFQIAFKPSLSQLGSAPVIINDAVLTGHDDFANVNVRVNKTSLSTRLSSDPAFPLGTGERVAE